VVASRVDAEKFLEKRSQAWVGKADWSFVEGKQCALSCHTTMPYLQAQPFEHVAATAMTDIDRVVSQRVANWASVRPLYVETHDKSDTGSRSVEAVTNAIASLRMDGLKGGKRSARTDGALSALFALQDENGCWEWLEQYDLKPFESPGAYIWGCAALVREASSRASVLSKRETAMLDRAVNFLKSKAADRATSLHGRMMIRLAGAENPRLAVHDEDLRSEILGVKGRDGGASLANLLGGDFDPSMESDGYATGFSALVLASMGEKPERSELASYGKWLLSHQAPNGSWPTRSINRSEAMWNAALSTDLASAYAYQALKVLKAFKPVAP
jgi:hypothetical protein